MSVPEWVQDAIFYQIFPDRFANGDHENDPPNLVHWGSPPTSWGFQGGDLIGILQKFDYLLDLGINAIYLNPIFQATSNHRYNTMDYYQIDPMLGTLDDFHNIVEIAHHNHVRIILDGVFNHCGRGFFAFNDVLENQEYSGYRDWFHIKRFPVDAYSWGEASDYLGWWGMKSLPKFNTNNPIARRYLMEVARYWIKQGADGWRLDVPNEINDDGFWAEFREVVKSANPEAYLVGEIWSADLRWVEEGHFDGLMNYPVMDALAGLLTTNTLDAAHFAEKVEGLLSFYPRDNAYAMYVPVDSHDTERILTRMGNNLNKTRLAYMFQFAYPGAPAIYYGDEIGLVGGKDPGCRGAFLWEETSWNVELRNFLKTLINLRKNHIALRRGDYIGLEQNSNPASYAFARTTAEDKVLIIMNASANESKVNINVKKIGWEDGRVVVDLITAEKQYTISNHSILVTLPGWGGLWLG
ncbi:MAG: glycoside hydrolase family 13 protein [Anaerolineales bacterium]